VRVIWRILMGLYDDEKRNAHFRAIGAVCLGVIIAAALLGIGIAIGHGLTKLPP
jgi:hypothetical protein